MSNTLFKKVTAAAAALSIVLSIVVPVVGVQAADDSTSAANRLAALGVIVDNSKDPSKYNLGSNITRREMLKVMMNLSSVEVGDTCEGKFADLPASDWGCKYAEAALKAGFIAANKNFRPNDMVTEAEALKMIMQARGVAKTEGITDWAQAYADAAVKAGILAEGTKVSTKAAKRSMVVVTADTAVTTTTSADTTDTTSTEGTDDLSGLFGDLFGDETGTDMGTGTTTDTTSTGTTTDTTSTGVTVSGGDVEVSLNPASTANGTQIPNNGTIRFAMVDFTAGNTDVSVNTVDLKSVGLAQVPTSTRVWFEKNGKRLSGKAAFSSDRTAVVSFAPALVVKAGSSETLDLYVELATDAGNDFQFSGKIASSSATNNNGEFVTNVLRTATYTVAPVTFAKGGANTTYNQSNDMVELGRFTLENKDTSSETRDVKFQSITLRQNESGDLADLTDLQVERNGVKVSSEMTVSGKDVTFVLNDTVKDGSTATYYVKAKVANVQNNSGDKYQFSLRNTTDLNAVEVLNGFRSTVTRADTDLNIYTVLGSDVKFERNSSVELSKNYAKGTSNVILLQGTITTKSPITLEDPTLTFTSSTGANLLFDTIYLQIGSSTMTWTAGTGTTASFLGLATVNSSADVKMYGKLRDSAPAANIKFDDLRLSSFTKAEYVSNQNTVTSAVGTISAVQVSVDSTTLSVTRVDGLGNTKMAVGSKAVTVYGVNLAVTQGNDVSISNAEYTVTASGSYTNNVFATLYVDGTAVSTKTINASTVKFDNLTKLVGKTPVNLTVKVDLSDAYSNGDFALKLTALDIVDTLTSQTVSLGTTPSSATFTVAQAKGTLSSSDNNPKRSLLLAGDKNQKVLAFRVKAENDNVKLRDLSFSGVNLDKMSNFRILTPTSKEIAATSSNASTVSFSNITPEDAITMDHTDTYYLIADLNTNVIATNVVVELLYASSNIKATNGSTIAMVGANVLSNTHLVDENKAVIAKATNSSKDISTSALRFSVTASGKDQVTLSGATFSNQLSGYTGSTVLVKVYKDTVSSANLVGSVSTTANGGDVTVPFTANNTVDASSTNNYIVVVDGVTIDANANTPSWTIRANTIYVGSIDASLYNNMGEFPLTETK
ncbi:MAG: S-layer homology domain-containing protein [Candidatus Gracilibacteria bacterium]|nr:S-layer homology domain-containing protein [Candidatus Gracilibacteria bacterium]